MPSVKPSENPFRSARVDALDYVSPSGESWEAIEARVQAAGFRGALVGPHGHGKTTLMTRLATLDPPSGADRHEIVQVAADGSNLDEVERVLSEERPRLFIDGYDLLPWRLRRAVRRHPEAIVTSHRETRMPTLLLFETTPNLLGMLIVRLSPAVHDALGDDAVASLHAVHRGNVRNALRELYDRTAAGEFAR